MTKTTNHTVGGSFLIIKIINSYYTNQVPAPYIYWSFGQLQPNPPKYPDCI